MKSKKILLVLLSLSLVGILALSACTMEPAKPAEAPAAPAAPAAAPAAAEKTKMKIGILTMGLSQSYFVDLSKGYKDMAAEYPGVDVEIVEVDPKFDAAQQVAGIENLTVLDVDAIIITAIDPKVVTTPVQDAMRKGIKIIAHYNKLDSQDFFSGISTFGMGFVAGKQAADWINQKLGGAAKVGLLIWEKTQFDIDRTLGMRAAISQYAPKSQIVVEVAADTQEVGLSVSETMLQAHPDIKVIVCYNGDGCLGALGAVEAAGLASNDFAIIGVGASNEELSKIKAGGIYRGTSSIDPYSHGRFEMEMAIRLVLGDFLPVSTEIQPVPVDTTNVDKFIK